MSAKKEKLLELAVKIHMAEYDRMVREIALGLQWHMNLVQYSLFLAASSVTAINLFPHFRELYLVASMILSLLGWAFTEQSYKMLLFGRYIDRQIRPKINGLIKNAGGNSKNGLYEMLGFDSYFRHGDLRTWLAGLPAAGKFAIAILPGALLAIAYWVTSPSPFNEWLRVEKGVFILCLLIGFLPIVSAIVTLPFFVKHGE